MGSIAHMGYLTRSWIRTRYTPHIFAHNNNTRCIYCWWWSKLKPSPAQTTDLFTLSAHVRLPRLASLWNWLSVSRRRRIYITDSLPHDWFLNVDTFCLNVSVECIEGSCYSDGVNVWENYENLAVQVIFVLKTEFVRNSVVILITEFICKNWIFKCISKNLFKDFAIAMGLMFG